ncbi:MAG: choice-of-anchor D domain-containing protein [Desulfobacteraceae bacterium]|nr:choice-of-anchor D domain-containing protein [Desulfobacteraceae bacterium]
MKKLIAFVICLSCFTANAMTATSLVWQTSKADAVSVAEKEGKKILMLAGRETCGNCRYMKNTVFESASPPIKSMIQGNFVPWFCDVDSSTEYQTYESGLGSYYLPLVCGIDPDDIDNYMDRTTGTQTPEEFYSRLEGLMSETEECRSYEEFKAVIKRKSEYRVTLFSIHLMYDFSFSEVENIINQAVTEIKAEDDYTAFTLVGHREQQWVGSDGDIIIYFNWAYASTYEQEQEVEQKIPEILDQIITDQMNDEQKVKAVHDWILTNAEYDTTLEGINAYSALFLGTAVCQGYSLLGYSMIQKLGIEVRIIEGDYNGGDHSWNMVRLCGNWYHLDITSDDPVPDKPGRVLYNYYNKSDYEMSSDHDWKYGVYPEAPISYEEGVCYYQNRITAAPASLDFGEVRTGTFSAPGNLTISNTGDEEIETGTVSVTGQDALEFMVQNDTCSDRTIGSSETCSLDVIFSPGSDGAKTANIILPDVANFPALNISLDGTGTETEPGWVKINGTVSGENGIPLCTMVLANGQYMFTCGENDGIYEMDVPLNENGIVSLFCFADGFAPFKRDLTPEQAKDLTADMTPASPDQPRMVLNTQAEPIVGSEWFKISGTVATEDGTLLCAMVLANGQHRFSCTQAGEYEMEVPLNENGEIALLSFADGFQPFSYTFKP